VRYGPHIVLQAAAKCGSRTLRSRLAPELPQRHAQTHAGLWAGEALPPALRRLTSIRDPLSWHLSHFQHWWRAWHGGMDRVVCWLAPAGRELVAGLLATFATPEEAEMACPGIRATVWGLYVEGVTDARVARLPLDQRPDALAHPQHRWDVPIRRWMAERGVGLFTWATVRQLMPAPWWDTVSLTPAAIRVGRDTGVPVRTLYDAAINVHHLDEGLAEVAEAWGLGVADLPERKRGDVADGELSPTPEQIERIRHAERAVYAWFPWDEDVPPVVWGHRVRR